MTSRQHPGEGNPSPGYAYKGWIRLGFITLLIVLATYLAPKMEKIPYVGDRITAIRLSGINAGAWYYDDVQECFEAAEYIRERRGLNHPDRQ